MALPRYLKALWRNDFFERTTLTGFLFISRAKSLAEVAVWWLVLMVFAVFTVRNLVDLLQLYNSHPTAIKVLVSSQINNATISDLTITLNLPRDELTTLPLSIEGSPYWHEPDSTYQYYSICLFLDELKTENWKPMKSIPQEQTNSSDISYKVWLDKQKKLFGNQMDKAWAKFDAVVENYQTPYETRLKAAVNLLNQLGNIVSSMEQQSNVHLPGLLDKLQEGGSDKLLSTVLKNLNKRILIETDKQAHIRLRHIESKEQTYQLTYSIDGGNNLNEIQISAFSLRLANYLIVLNSVAKIVAKRKKREQNDVHKIYDNYNGFNSQKEQKFRLTQMCNHRIASDLELLYETISMGYAGNIWLRIHSTSSSGSDLNLALQHTTVTLTPNVRFKSDTIDCYNLTKTQCEDECLSQSYMDTCACLPWQLSYVKNTSTICSKPCQAASQTHCSLNCEVKREVSCDQTLFHVQQTSYPRKHLSKKPLYTYYEFIEFSPEVYTDVPLLSTKIIIKQAMHASYIEHYSMNIGDLVAALGGLLDFWLSINIIAVLHLIIHILKQFASKRTQTEDSFTKNDLPYRGIKLLRAKINKLKQRHKQRKANFLFYNEFYEETLLSGFAFINYASSKIEKVFWYLVIVSLFGLSAYNVSRMIDSFMAKPTVTRPEMLVNLIDPGIGNFSFSISYSYFEHFSFVTQESSDSPTPEAVEYRLLATIFSPLYFVTDLMYACQRGDDFYKPYEGWGLLFGNYEGEDLNDNLRVFKEASFLEDEPAAFTQRRMLWDLWGLDNQTKNISSWYQQISEPFNNQLNDMWRNLFSKSMGPDDRFIAGFESRARDAFEAIIKPTEGHIWPTMMIALCMLQATKSGADWRQIGHQELLFTVEKQGGTNVFNKPDWMPGHPVVNAHYLLAANQMTLKQLFRGVSNHIKKSLFISAGHFELTDAQIDSGSSSEQLHFRAVIPPNTTEVTIDLYSYNLARFLILAKSMTSSLNEFFAKQCATKTNKAKPSCRRYTKCFGDGKLGQQYINNLIYETFVGNMLDHLSETTWLRIELPSGTQQVATLQKSDIELIATGRYVSETFDCSLQTVDTCVELCKAETHMNICNCTPWHLYYVTSNKSVPFCVEPCSKAEAKSKKCEISCTELLARPCATTLYRLGHVKSYELPYYHWSMGLQSPVIQAHLPMLSVTIKLKKNIMHPQLTERYSMTKSKLMADLGGLLEFWVGVSGIAVVHLIVFVTRKYCTARSLFVL